MASRNLTPASGRQDHTTSPSAEDITRRLMSQRPSHPAPNVRDDREAPLLRERNGVNVKYIGGVSQAPRLRQNGTTGRLRMVDIRKLPVRANQPRSRLRLCDVKKPVRCLEPDRFCLNQNRGSNLCFDAFSSREPASTSLENALVSDVKSDLCLNIIDRVVLDDGHADLE
jgi:hypothetical protein